MLLLAVAAAAQDDWKVPAPKSAPKGKPFDLRAKLDGDLAPHARVTLVQKASGEIGEGQSTVEFDAWVAAARDGSGKPLSRTRIDIIRIDGKGEDLTEGVRAAAPDLFVVSTLDARGRVVDATLEGADALPALRKILLPSGAWVVPWLPEKPVKVGEAWQVPSEPFLWTLNQIGIRKSEGAAWQRLEAVEKREGVECARIRTTFGLFHTLAKSEPVHNLGDGPVEVRVKGEGTDWFGLDGFLRETSQAYDVTYKNPATGKSVRVHVERTVKSAPAKPAAAPSPDDWSGFTGDLAFAIGYDEGMKEARFTGRAPMFFYVSRRSAEARAFGSAIFRDKDVLKRISGYTPVLIDADADKQFAQKVPAAMIPAVYWIDFDGDVIFTAAGAMPADLFGQIAEVAEARVPDPAPTPEYRKLEEARDAMRKALAANDTKGALAAILAIRGSERGLAIRREAAQADAKLTDAGAKRLEEADALARKKKTKEARALLEAVRAEYVDHEIGRKAADALAKLPAK